MGYEPRVKNHQIDGLCEAVLTIGTVEECYKFLEDICTIKEIQAISQRFEVAKLLKSKKTYTEIEALTGASTATISRVNRSLTYGVDGYKLVFERLGIIE